MASIRNSDWRKDVGRGIELPVRPGAVKRNQIDQSQYLDSREYDDVPNGTQTYEKDDVANSNFQGLSANGGFEAGALRKRNENSPLPQEGMEVFPLDTPLAQSHLGRIPQSRVLSFQTGLRGTVEEPWFKGRRWTVPKGLVAAYTMEAGAGTVVRDDSGNFRDGTMSSAFTWSASGHNGYCLSNDGTHRYLQLPAALDFGATDAWSFAIWAKEDASQIGVTWFFASPTLSTAKHLLVYTDNKLTFRDDTGTYRILSDALTRTNWNHYVVTYNNGTLKSYINGTYWGTVSASSVMGFQYLLSTYSSGGNYHPLNGSADDIRIYNRDISADEASALYAETAPYEDVYNPPCDNAVWLGKTTTNMVATTDLNDSTKWRHEDVYYSTTVRGNVFDSELQKTVFRWGKGSNANYTFIFDSDALSSPAAGSYVSSLMIKCNYDIVVFPYFYGPTPGYMYGPAQTVPANTWTLVTGKITTALTTYTTLAWQIQYPGLANFDSDIEFRACDPYVALESYPMPFVPTTRPAGSLWYNFEWPQQGTVGFWTIPRFGFNVATNKYFVSDFNGAVVNLRVWYDKNDDKWTAQMSGSITVKVQGTAITSNADLWKPWFIAVTWDIPNDSLKLYCYNSDYPSGDNASSSSDLGTVSFEPYLSIGGIPLYTSPTGYEADAFMAGLFVDGKVWSEAELKAHYQRGRSFTNGGRLPASKEGMFFSGGKGQIYGRMDFGEDAYIDGETGKIGGRGVYNNTTATAANVNVDSSGNLLRSTSSVRYKTQVEDLFETLAKGVLSLRSVWYRSKCDGDKKEWSWYGLLAEEVEKIDPRLVQYEDREGRLIPQGVDYSRVGILLLKAFQMEYQRTREKEKEYLEQSEAIGEKIKSLEGGIEKLWQILITKEPIDEKTPEALKEDEE